jgi:hypothetical protein
MDSAPSARRGRHTDLQKSEIINIFEINLYNQRLEFVLIKFFGVEALCPRPVKHDLHTP